MKLALLSGAHSHTAGYLNEIRDDPELELVAVWDDMESRGREIAQEMDCAFFRDLEQALGCGGVDASIVCADNAGHRPLVEASCAAGIDVFCEKPMALTLEDAEAMVGAISDSGCLAAFGYFLPFTGPALAARKLLAEGELGDVTQVRFRNAHHAAYGQWFDSEDRRWFTQPEKSGGGAFLDMGTHAVHFVRTLLGPVRSVSAVIENKCGVYPEVDDFGVALLEFESGVTGIAEASWVFTTGQRGLEVVGSDGGLTLDGDVLELTPFDDGPGDPVEIAAEPEEPSRLARLRALKDGDLSRCAMETDLACCRDAVAIMCAAYESARTGQCQTVAAVS